VTAPAWRSPADLRGELAPSIAAGDQIRTGEEFHPHYQLIALSEDKAWIRDLQHGTDHIIPIDRCPEIGCRGSSPW
jgi:hypothetical protein